MAFQQLYYTSCENGLAGYGGYQFNAVTPGVSPVVMREIEDRTVYEPPRWLLAEPSPEEPEAYPVAFSHWASETPGTVITTHVVFAGADYSGRPGNYFVHALVTSAAEHDYGAVLPVELWGAQLWRSRPVHDTRLPELPGPPPRGVVDRAGVQAFLDVHGAEGVLRQLLTAAGRAMAGDRPVLLASQDASENVWWIAAVCYLFGEQLGRQLSFTTYSHQAAYSRYHLIGVLSDALPPDADSAFQLFDLATGRTPAGTVHPLATVLADTGVMAAPGLWQQAQVFASGNENSLDDWLAPVAAAAGLLRGRMSDTETRAVARWLPGAAARLQAEHADVVLGVILAQPDAVLADERLRELLALARRLQVPSRVDHLGRLIAERALGRLGRGESAEPVRLTGPAADIAREWAAKLLGGATAGAAARVLEWAAASGAAVPDEELERYGRTILDPAEPEQELARVLGGRPAIMRGLLARLAGEPPAAAEAVLGGQAGTLVGRADLAPYPELTELWLLISAARGRMTALDAFDEIVDARDGANRSPRFDAALLRRLWPGRCPPEEIAELLAAVDSPPGADVVEWFGNEIAAHQSRGRSEDGWLRLSLVVADHPILAILPGEAASITRNAAVVAPALLRARSTVPEGDVEVFGELYDAYRAGDKKVRGLLIRELPSLLAEADPLGAALTGCPQSIVARFCDALENLLAPPWTDLGLAVRVFAALGHPGVAEQPATAGKLAAVFEQTWDDLGRHRHLLARALKKDKEAAERFEAWRDERRGPVARRLRARAVRTSGRAAPEPPGEPGSPPRERGGAMPPADGR
jgi:GTPase-associated protein 1, N-terminal domain type 2/GTPase-associated protein 1, C-terminal domain/GTPase-associated protein 1, middle domain